MTYFSILCKTGDLESYLAQHASELFELANVPYNQLVKERVDFEDFVFFNRRKVESLNFSESRNKAFLLFLFDIAERLEASDSLQYICNWLAWQGIQMDSRLKAAYIYLVNAHSDNAIFIDKFDEICGLIHKSIREESDSQDRPLETFTNYYLKVLSVHPKWVLELRQKINDSNKYPFLKSNIIQEILNIDVTNQQSAYEQIELLKDKLFKRNVYREPHENFLIEKGTHYEEILRNKGFVNFKVVRKIAVDNTDYGEQLADRGVSPLRNEHEMFVYLKNYGNMHYAKLQSAYNSINIKSIISTYSSCHIIDWGCGQAIASMSLLARIIDIKNLVFYITLIEPSEIALKRAALHVDVMLSKSKANYNIKTICKEFDNLSNSDLQRDDNARVNIQLFSNVLDIESFSISKLINNIKETQHERNLFFCVSPYINLLKTERVNAFMEAFNNEKGFHEYMHEENPYDGKYWNCNNKFNNNMCSDHLEPFGCDRKWKRVVNVFECILQ